MTDLGAEGALLLGGTLRRVEMLHGGDLSRILRITLADGREAIVKGGPAPRTEAAMLAAIAAAGTPAPAVLAVSDTVLVMTPLAADGALDDAWPSVATALSALHATTGTRYGWDVDYAFGAVPVPNAWAGDWPRFWAERRLLPHCPHLAPGLGRRVDQLAMNLPDRLPRRPPPALLHGDLWGGNVLVSAGQVSGLIDPACYYGHAEVDLAMLALFDRPSPEFFAAYGPPVPGRAERLPIYQLFPALVHLRLFGASYRALVDRLLSAAGA